MPSSKRKRKLEERSPNEDNSNSDDEERRKKKRSKKEKKRKHRKEAEDMHLKRKDKKKKQKKSADSSHVGEKKDAKSSDMTVEEGKRKSMRPMTKEEWEKQQSVVRRVYDESTGRSRLIKGDGEVLEEIVSRSRQQEINRQATKGDGMWFQSKMGLDSK